MTILAYAAPTAGDRPPLPTRPMPHERDGRQPLPSGGRPHPQQSAAAADSVTVDFLDEALRRVVAQQIGPRGVGAIYTDRTGTFEVVALVRDPARARELLDRRCAQWALIVKNILQPEGEPFATGDAWTAEDQLDREADAVRTGRTAVAA